MGKKILVGFGVLLLTFSVYFSFKSFLNIDLYLLIKNLFFLKYVPELGNDAGYGLLFLLGLLTSVHCIGMCGGVALCQTIGYKSSDADLKASFHWMLPSALYNLGRVFGYTAVGAIVGGIGQVISLSGALKGFIPIIGGIFMVIMGVNLLGFFPFLRKITISMPYFAAKKIHGKNNYGPFYIGALTALMPCGPLQIVQLYALGTRSFTLGGVSMMIFSLGTVPLLFIFGVLSSFINKKNTARILKISSAVVILLGLIMISRGLSLSGINFKMPHSNIAQSSAVSRIDGGYQFVTTSIEANSYPSITIQKGIPVKWTIKAEESKLNQCNNAINIPILKLEKKLISGENLIEFTPNEEGEFVYTCWMGMIKSKIIVVNNIKAVDHISNIKYKKEIQDENTKSQQNGILESNEKKPAEDLKEPMASNNQEDNSMNYSKKEVSKISEEKDDLAVEQKSSEPDTAFIDSKPNFNEDNLINEKSTIEAKEPKPKQTTFEGYLQDKHCFGRMNPIKETRACLTMNGCAASGYGIAVLQDDGKSLFYSFDERGNILAKELLSKVTRNINFLISVTGIMEDGLLKVEAIEVK